MQSPSPTSAAGLHVALIMDGNGRWAGRRSLPRIAGHRKGADAVRRTVRSAPGLGVTTLTLYAFSSDNWGRPPEEVEALMDLLTRYLRREWRRCRGNGVRINVIGRRDRLAPRVLEAIRHAEEGTAGASALHLRQAVDYSSRDAILTAAGEFRSGMKRDRGSFSSLLNQAIHSDPPAPDVDLLIRTSGEQRLSDFLLWECAYAEIVFTPTLWPDFDEDALAGALEEFRSRDRRFGRVREAS